MFKRATFFTFLMFWVTMTYLLWRSEYLVRNQSGSTVPVSLVWRKILNAPDASSLEITHNGRKMGYCRWSSSIGQELAESKLLTDAAATSAGPAVVTSGTKLELEGKFLLGDDPTRLQVHGELLLATNDEWLEFNLRLALKPDAWEVHSRASDKTIRLRTDGDEGPAEHIYSFTDLQNPLTLLKDFGVSAPIGMLGMLAPSANPQKGHSLAFGLEWKACNDWFSVGHTSVRAFRLDAAVLDRYRMRIIVSRVGEILRVDLPDGWSLVNDQLLNL
jgi:hypothetical protein